MADESKICAPIRKRITPNWEAWLESFGSGIEVLVDKYLGSQGEALADKLDSIFAEIVNVVTVLYDGFGFTSDQLGRVSKAVAIERVNTKQRQIRSIPSKATKAAAIASYIRMRQFVPIEAARLRDSILPAGWSNPFDPREVLNRSVDGRFIPFNPRLSNYKQADNKEWGGRGAKYSKAGHYEFCMRTLREMPDKAIGYVKGYWTDISFVSDGTCGSACALFTQGIQTNGDAVAFTYGGIANKALDVASFAGGNVEDYEDFWPKLAFTARVAKLASGGQAPWIKAHEKTWVSSPIAFPTKASANFNWNMMFVEAMGPDALPRQFYLIPGRRHFNLWGSDKVTKTELYRQITVIENWKQVQGQFAVTHGQCPLEQVPGL
jgi:hypothetical protein